MSQFDASACNTAVSVLLSSLLHRTHRETGDGLRDGLTAAKTRTVHYDHAHALFLAQVVMFIQQQAANTHGVDEERHWEIAVGEVAGDAVGDSQWTGPRRRRR